MKCHSGTVLGFKLVARVCSTLAWGRVKEETIISTTELRAIPRASERRALRAIYNGSTEITIVTEEFYPLLQTCQTLRPQTNNV